MIFSSKVVGVLVTAFVGAWGLQMESNNPGTSEKQQPSEIDAKIHEIGILLGFWLRQNLLTLPRKFGPSNLSNSQEFYSDKASYKTKSRYPAPRGEIFEASDKI